MKFGRIIEKKLSVYQLAESLKLINFESKEWRESNEKLKAASQSSGQRIRQKFLQDYLFR